MNTKNPKTCQKQTKETRKGSTTRRDGGADLLGSVVDMADEGHPLDEPLPEAEHGRPEPGRHEDPHQEDEGYRCHEADPCERRSRQEDERHGRLTRSSHQATELQRTKYVDPEMNKDRREKPIDKMNEPPGDVECDRYWEQDDAARIDGTSVSPVKVFICCVLKMKN